MNGPASKDGLRVLHVPFTYFPDASGGTEVYVRGLAEGLAKIGFRSAIAAPGATAALYWQDGLEVHRFATDRSARLDQAYGAPDEIAAEGFRAIVATTAPDIVHFHARTSAVSELLVDIAHRSGAKSIFTYHTPTASCVRGTMMLFGESPCDGALERRRCSACVLAAHGVPKWAGALCASMPDWINSALAQAAAGNKLATGLSIPSLIESAQSRFQLLMEKVDHVVAVCQWVYDLLLRNGVPASKITLSRQGIFEGRTSVGAAAPRVAKTPLKLAYFGRIDPAKGVDLLVQALALIPTAEVRLDCFAVNQSSDNAQLQWISAQAARDSRIALRPAVAPEDVQTAMTAYDLIAIPSRWLETGPLVALEAFAAGTPVLGANLGGIAELVRNGIDGLLVAPDDVAAWAGAISALLDDPHRLEMMRAHICPPRTMRLVADEMAALYERALA